MIVTNLISLALQLVWYKKGNIDNIFQYNCQNRDISAEKFIKYSCLLSYQGKYDRNWEINLQFIKTSDCYPGEVLIKSKEQIGICDCF